MSETLGEMVMLIATRLSLKWTFVRYTYREDLVSAAVLNCVRYLYRFNPAKSTNVFAYCTQICFNAMLRQIATEKEIVYTRLKFQGAQPKSARSESKQNAAMQEKVSETIAAFETAIQQKKDASEMRKRGRVALAIIV
jgi:DNA-directed RNA polymerase specialized sigma subunit